MVVLRSVAEGATLLAGIMLEFVDRPAQRCCDFVGTARGKIVDDSGEQSPGCIEYIHPCYNDDGGDGISGVRLGRDHTSHHPTLRVQVSILLCAHTRPSLPGHPRLNSDRHLLQALHE